MDGFRGDGRQQCCRGSMAGGIESCELHLRTETSHSLSMQLQWLDSLPADQLAHLAAMEATPTGTAAGNPAAGSSGSGANGGLPAEGPGTSGAKGPVRRNNSSNGSNKA